MQFVLFLASVALASVVSAQTNQIMTHSAESDLSAEAFCAGQFTGRGWVYAVRRLCGVGTNCEWVCRSEIDRNEDPQTAENPRMRCFDAVHVYSPFIPSTQRGVNLFSHKVFRYSHCYDQECGPNYCCCAIDHDVLTENI